MPLLVTQRVFPSIVPNAPVRFDATVTSIDLLSSLNSVRITIQTAPDVNGQSDASAAWKDESESIWVGCATRPGMLNGNPRLGVPAASGFRVRTILTNLGPPITIDGTHTVESAQAQPA